MKSLNFLLLFFLILPTVCYSQNDVWYNVHRTIRVGYNLPNAQSCYSSIQAAINASSDGDLILVHPGTYNENIVLNKYITMRSDTDGYPETYDIDPENTFLDGSNSGSVINIHTANCLDGFTIQNGNSLYGAGVLIDSSPLAEDYGCIISNNIFRNNAGHGIYIDPINKYVSPLIWNNLFYNNDCGIYSKNGVAEIWYATIANNTTGIYFENTDSLWLHRIYNSIIYNNPVHVPSVNSVHIFYSNYIGVSFPAFLPIPHKCYYENPRFVDSANNDYHLQHIPLQLKNSLCLNLGLRFSNGLDDEDPDHPAPEYEHTTQAWTIHNSFVRGTTRTDGIGESECGALEYRDTDQAYDLGFHYPPKYYDQNKSYTQMFGNYRNFTLYFSNTQPYPFHHHLENILYYFYLNHPNLINYNAALVDDSCWIASTCNSFMFNMPTINQERYELEPYSMYGNYSYQIYSPVSAYNPYTEFLKRACDGPRNSLYGTGVYPLNPQQDTWYSFEDRAVPDFLFNRYDSLDLNYRYNIPFDRMKVLSLQSNSWEDWHGQTSTLTPVDWCKDKIDKGYPVILEIFSPYIGPHSGVNDMNHCITLWDIDTDLKRVTITDSDDALNPASGAIFPGNLWPSIGTRTLAYSYNEYGGHIFKIKGFFPTNFHYEGDVEVQYGCCRNSPTFTADRLSVKHDETTTINFSIDAGYINKDRPYTILTTTLSAGSRPCPGTTHLPFALDTDNTYLYFLQVPGFFGYLDEKGRKTVSLTIPANSLAIGKVFNFAFVLDAPFDFSSTPVQMHIVN